MARAGAAHSPTREFNLVSAGVFDDARPLCGIIKIGLHAPRPNKHKRAARWGRALSCRLCDLRFCVRSDDLTDAAHRDVSGDAVRSNAYGFCGADGPAKLTPAEH